MVPEAMSVHDVMSVLATYQRVEEPLAGDVPAVLVSHGVQCAEILAAERPDDVELQAAGLVHDMGLLLRPGDELGHPHHGAQFVGRLLGPRVASLVRLHVDAQRYLEVTREGYTVAPPPTAGLADQPLTMTPGDIARFEADPLHAELLVFRGADDRADDMVRREADLSPWADLLAQVAARQVSAGGA